MLLSQALIPVTCEPWHQRSAEGMGFLGEKVEAVLEACCVLLPGCWWELTAPGRCLHATALSSGASCIFNQTASPSLLSNF